MKLFFILLLLYSNLQCDAIEKIWQITEENGITFTKISPSVYALNDVPANIDDLPLAKTYPVDEEVLPQRSVVEKKDPKYDVSTDRNIKESIEELKNSLESDKADEAKEEKKKSQGGIVKDEESGGIGYYTQFLQENPRMATVLFSAIGSLLLLFWLFTKKNSKSKKPQEDPEDERFTKTLTRFLNLKGKIHEQFIIRKQNILFNNDFTQYQKAKALLELEKEYNDLEYFQVSKLLCNDFPQFVKAGEVLTSRPELKDIVSEYIEDTLQYRDYTKEQKRILREKLKNFYNTGRHTWEYEQTLEANAKKEQTAYLLQ